MKFEEAKLRVMGMDRIHLEDRARWMVEVYKPSIGGMELLLPSKDLTKVDTEEKRRILILQSSTFRLWNEATVSYVYERFQGCIILLAAMLEATLELKLRLMNLWRKFEETYKPEDRTLGRLLKFCESKDVLSTEIIKLGWKVNNLRIDAVHLKAKKRVPQNMVDVTNLDEIHIFKRKEELKEDP